MVCRLNPEDCYCETCNGGDPAPPGYFGGTYCPCECHGLKGMERAQYFLERKKRRDAAMEAAVAHYKKLTPR